MVKVETLDTILEFFQDKDVQEKAAEVGRLFFTNGSVTVNLIPVLLFSFLGSLCKCLNCFWLRQKLKESQCLSVSMAQLCIEP